MERNIFHLLVPYSTCRACNKRFTITPWVGTKMEGFCFGCACSLYASSASGNVLACGHVSIMHRSQIKTEDCFHRICTREKMQTEQSPCAFCNKTLASEACVSLACGHIYHYSCYGDQIRKQLKKSTAGEELCLAGLCCAICSRVFSWRGLSLLDKSLKTALAATLKYACKVGDVHTVRELANKDLEGAFLHTAAHFGQAEVIKILAKKSKRGLKFDERVGLLEHIPLHVAVTGGHERVVMLLVALGADVNVRKSTNITPLHEAAKKKGEMVELLLRLGAHVDARANNNVTPLHLAVTSGDCMAVKALLEYGANVNAKNDHGFMPLHIAVAQGNGGTTKLLVDAGASVDEGILNLSDDPQITQILKPTETCGASQDQERCTVCLDECELPKKLKCGHSFCWECLSNLLSKSFTTCPNCRAPILL